MLQSPHFFSDCTPYMGVTTQTTREPQNLATPGGPGHALGAAEVARQAPAQCAGMGGVNATTTYRPSTPRKDCLLLRGALSRRLRSARYIEWYQWVGDQPSIGVSSLKSNDLFRSQTNTPPRVSNFATWIDVRLNE
jgi:hypothetical protein